MRIVGIYSFKGGRDVIESKYQEQYREVKEIISAVNSGSCKKKISKEKAKTKAGKILYSPIALNRAFKREFRKYAWKSHRIRCTYPTKYYEDFTPRFTKPGYREMDFVKDRLGVEIQFGKYSFMVYNVCAKMTIFNKQNIIDAGIEIVPVKDFAKDMSSGVSFFEQFVWDLENRGEADIDIPVLVLGITA